MKKLTLALTGLGVLLGLALLLQGLFWLIWHVPDWSLIASRGQWWMVIGGVPLVVIFAALATLVLSRPTRAARGEAAITALAALIIQPFLVVTGTLALWRVVGSEAMSTMAGGIVEAISFPYVLTALLFSDMGRYLSVSAVALGLIAVGAAWSARREGDPASRRLPLYVLAIALVPVVAFPLMLRSIPYRPPVEPDADVDMEVVARSRWPFATVRMCRAIAGVATHQYEPLGWADEETLVYRVWRGGRHGGDGWRSQPGSPGAPLAYHLPDGAIARFQGDLSDLHADPCDPAACVEPVLADVPSYHPGRFEEPVVSPGGGWIAFTAWGFDRPEDLLVISAP